MFHYYRWCVFICMLVCLCETIGTREKEREWCWSMNDCLTLLCWWRWRNVHCTHTETYWEKWLRKTSSYTQSQSQTIIFEVAVKTFTIWMRTQFKLKWKHFILCIVYTFTTVAAHCFMNKSTSSSHHRYLNDSTSCFTSIIVFDCVCCCCYGWLCFTKLSWNCTNDIGEENKFDASEIEWEK